MPEFIEDRHYTIEEYLALDAVGEAKSRHHLSSWRCSHQAPRLMIAARNFTGIARFLRFVNIYWSMLKARSLTASIVIIPPRESGPCGPSSDLTSTCPFFRWMPTSHCAKFTTKPEICVPSELLLPFFFVSLRAIY